MGGGGGAGGRWGGGGEGGAGAGGKGGREGRWGGDGEETYTEENHGSICMGRVSLCYSTVLLTNQPIHVDLQLWAALVQEGVAVDAILGGRHVVPLFLHLPYYDRGDEVNRETVYWRPSTWTMNSLTFNLRWEGGDFVLIEGFDGNPAVCFFPGGFAGRGNGKVNEISAGRSCGGRRLLRHKATVKKR